MVKDLVKFKIRAREFPFYFNVLVYPNLKSMRHDADKHDKKVGLLMDHSQIYGVCHGYERVKIFKDGHEEPSKDIGIIRICVKWLTAEVYTHELLHAALYLYRRDGKGKANFGENIDEREEKVCHIYGRLYRDFLKKMYKHRLFA